MVASELISDSCYPSAIDEQRPVWTEPAIMCHVPLGVELPIILPLQLVLHLTAHQGWLVNLNTLDLAPSFQFVYLGLDFITQAARIFPSLTQITGNR